MHSQWTKPDTLELVLLGSGVVLIVAMAATASLKRQWKSVFLMPTPTENRLEPLDLLIGLAAMWVVPGVIYKVIAGNTHTETTSQPTSLPTDQADVTQLSCGAVGLILAFVVLMWIGRGRFRGGWSGWGMDFRRLPVRFLQAVVAYIAIWPVCFGVLQLTVFIIRLIMPDFEPQEHTTIKTLMSGEAGTTAFFLTVISALILAPIVEELLFRGLIQPLIAKAARSQWVAIVFTGVAFGIFHVPLYHAVPALGIFGILLGYLYARTNSLVLVICLHIVFNGKTLLWLALGATQ